MTDSPDGINLAGKPFRVLIADDKPGDLGAIRGILEAQKFEIPATFQNGRDLLKWVKDHPGGADVLVLDIVMPILDGFAAFYEMQKLDKPPRTLFYSVENSAAIVRKLIEDGAADFLVKPIKEEALRGALKKILQGAAAR